MTVTDIRDAKAFREMGVPLTTPVIERAFPPQQEEQINAVARAMAAFRKRIDAFCKNKNKNRSGFYAVRRAHDKLAYLIRKGTEPTQDIDAMAAALFIEKFTTCTDGWQELFDAADEAGEAAEPLTITAEQFAVLWPFNGKHIMDDGERAA